MIKLYRFDDEGLRYHEAWATLDGITEHWGRVGERGETREHPRPDGAHEQEALELVLAPARAAGFEPIEPERHAVLLVEYRVDPPEGTERGVELAERVEARLDEALGWMGLGHCDGYSLGLGTLEVCCLVVDDELAQEVIAADLAGSEYAHYTRIYEE